MNSLLSKLLAAFPWLGTRPVTETDLLGFCADRKIELVWSTSVTAGIYVVFDGADFIFLNSKLYGRRLLHVFAHEIGHYLLHVPNGRRFAAEFYTVHDKRKKHCEAEAVAALLLLPIPELEDLLIAGVYKHDPDLAALIGTRLDVWSKHKV